VLGSLFQTENDEKELFPQKERLKPTKRNLTCIKRRLLIPDDQHLAQNLSDEAFSILRKDVEWSYFTIKR
jgi:hypothetical protein